MSSHGIKIVIVEDQSLMAKALTAWLARETDFVILGNAVDGEAGLALCEKTKPDLALVDIQLPKLDGLELAQQLLSRLPQTRILMMSGQTDPYTIWRVLQSGVHGFIEKTHEPEGFSGIIRAIVAGGCYFSPMFQKVKADWLSQPEAFQKVLSNREQEVLRRLASGADDQNIADQLGIAVTTVSVHRKHVREKLGLHNDRELMVYARQWGLG